MIAFQMNAPALQNTLIRWSEAHAWVMLAVMALDLLHMPLMVSAVAAAISFGWLVILGASQWTPHDRFGGANFITLTRLLATLSLLATPAIHPVAAFAVSLTILLLDGVDGWTARKYGLSSEFGEYFDKEVDAFFMLALCLLLARSGHVGSWILLAGGLRYLFVLFLKFAKPPQSKETANRFGKAVCATMLAVLIACLWPLTPYCSPLALAASSALIASFANSIRQMYSGR